MVGDQPSQKNALDNQRHANIMQTIKNVYGIDVSTDSGDIPSANMCHKCYARSLCIVKAMKAGANPSEKKTLQNAENDVLTAVVSGRNSTQK